MLTLDQRALAVLVAAWRLLPPMKNQALIAAVFLEDMGAKHGSYGIDDERMGLSTRLFQGENAAQLLMIDVHGNSPPQVAPFCSRALHTAIHELAHAIGAGTGLDATQEWLGLSSWVKDDDDPQGTGRYWENRPGWGPHGPSPWRYRLNTWFPRFYSTKSPHECFADCVAHIALGWSDFFEAPQPQRANAIAKLRYLRREVWGERGALALAAARSHWQQRWGLAAARPKRHAEEAEEPENTIEEAVVAFTETQRKQALASPWTFGDTTAAVLALSLAIAPRLLQVYRATWRTTVGGAPSMPPLDAELSAMHQAATSYVTTTHQALQTALATLPGTATGPEVAAVVHEVYDKAARRASQLAVTEVHRATEAAKLAAWQATGTAQWGIWRVRSARPCGHCLALHGRRVPLGDMFFRKGDESHDAAGKTLKLDYADVHTPPLHPLCACTLEGE